MPNITALAADLAAYAAAKCGPGESALIMIDVTDGPSLCVACDETARSTAAHVAAEPEPSLLYAAVVTGAGDLTPYYPEGTP